MQCRPTVKDIYNFIDSIAPFNQQCEWDNSGMLVGESDKEVKKIALVLDITAEAVKKAAEIGADLIISHHPVIFKAAKTFTDNDPAFLLAKNGISAICAHTSLDCAAGGVNDVLAKALGFKNAFPLPVDGEAAIVRVAETDTDAETLAKLVGKKLNAGTRLADSGKRIKKVALCGGAGGDFIEAVAESGCDAYITGDVSHHEFLDALAIGLTIIAAGHFETENPVIFSLAEKIKNNFAVETEIIPQNSPVKYYF